MICVAGDWKWSELNSNDAAFDGSLIYGRSLAFRHGAASADRSDCDELLLLEFDRPFGARFSRGCCSVCQQHSYRQATWVSLAASRAPGLSSIVNTAMARRKRQTDGAPARLSGRLRVSCLLSYREAERQPIRIFCLVSEARRECNVQMSECLFRGETKPAKEQNDARAVQLVITSPGCLLILALRSALVPQNRRSAPHKCNFFIIAIKFAASAVDCFLIAATAFKTKRYLSSLSFSLPVHAFRRSVIEFSARHSPDRPMQEVRSRLLCKHLKCSERAARNEMIRARFRQSGARGTIDAIKNYYLFRFGLSPRCFPAQPREELISSLALRASTSTALQIEFRGRSSRLFSLSVLPSRTRSSSFDSAE